MLNLQDQEDMLRRFSVLSLEEKRNIYEKEEYKFEETDLFERYLDVKNTFTHMDLDEDMDRTQVMVDESIESEYKEYLDLKNPQDWSAFDKCLAIDDEDYDQTMKNQK